MWDRMIQARICRSGWKYNAIKISKRKEIWRKYDGRNREDRSK